MICRYEYKNHKGDTVVGFFTDEKQSLDEVMEQGTEYKIKWLEEIEIVDILTRRELGL